MSSSGEKKDGAGAAQAARLYILCFVTIAGVLLFLFFFLQRAHYIAFSIRRDRRPVSRLYRHDERWRRFKAAAEHIYITLVFLGTSGIFLTSGECWIFITYNCCTFGTSRYFTLKLVYCCTQDCMDSVGSITRGPNMRLSLSFFNPEEISGSSCSRNTAPSNIMIQIPFVLEASITTVGDLSWSLASDLLVMLTPKKLPSRSRRA